MRKRPLPQTLEAARSEIERLERRVRSDQKRIEDVSQVMGHLHSDHKLPAVGSRWIRSMDVGLRGGRKVQTAYEFVAYAHGERGPVLVFLGTFDSGQQHTAVSIATFHREFDPAPKARSRGRRAS